MDKKLQHDNFLVALKNIKKAFESISISPIIVGSAAIEMYSMGEYISGDIDLVFSGDDNKLYKSLIDYGWKKEDRKYHQIKGCYHPNYNIGLEIVASTLFDGDSYKINIIDGLKFISIEDLIADRLGQYNSSPNKVHECLEQAEMLYKIHSDNIDYNYLNKRIKKETLNDYNIDILKMG